MNTAGIVIQARMSSKRLPGKVLMNFCGKPMLLFQIELLKKFNFNVEIVIATSNKSLDDGIEELCKKFTIKYIRGSEDNVFSRFQIVAEMFGFDHMVRLTGDNPVSNYRILSECLKMHLKNNPDLTSTRKIYPDHSIERYVVKGNSVDIIKCKTLLSIDDSLLNAYEKEHVIPVFYNGNYSICFVKDLDHDHAFSTSIDTQKDFQRVSKYAENLVESDQLLNTLGYKE